MSQSREENKLDAAIEREYYRRAHGVHINIMNINPLFAYARERVAEGVDLGLAVQDAISKYRELNEVIP